MDLRKLAGCCEVPTETVWRDGLGPFGGCSTLNGREMEVFEDGRMDGTVRGVVCSNRKRMMSRKPTPHPPGTPDARNDHTQRVAVCARWHIKGGSNPAHLFAAPSIASASTASPTPESAAARSERQSCAGRPSCQTSPTSSYNPEPDANFTPNSKGLVCWIRPCGDSCCWYGTPCTYTECILSVRCPVYLQYT
ncbi:uncharacterized protein LOC123681548 [Harmonia axyridis]|uniref:uncharacterized protein LOC123681548 n=1 Tax=Harmonia axyridis TaxID=115357 RepID=UPI001E278154|nr:uncharacterized protein LOC123681548 [Harmonia axyridis]